MATDDEGVFLADQVSEIDQGGPWSGHSGQDEQLGPVVLDVILHLSQLLDADQRVAVNLRLRRRSPVDLCASRQSTTFLINRVGRVTGFPVDDEQVEEEDDGEGDERHRPADQEHGHHAQGRREQAQPHVVVLFRFI